MARVGQTCVLKNAPRFDVAKEPEIPTQCRNYNLRQNCMPLEGTVVLA